MDVWYFANFSHNLWTLYILITIKKLIKKPSENIWSIEIAMRQNNFVFFEI